jgi:putative hemolysin
VRRGPEALYTQTLFEYGPRFLRALGPALELGRSFVRAEYQRSSCALAALWQGIGRLSVQLGAHPTLFGAVSISARYSPTARALMRAALERWGELEPLRHMVQPRSPFSGPEISRRRLSRLRDPEALDRAVAALDLEGKELPVLVRRYVQLGGRFIGFNVDPSFRDALDGLVVVDLRRTEPRLLRFYLGPLGWETFQRRWRRPPTPLEIRAAWSSAPGRLP